MSSETFSPWDSAEILGDNETMIEYLEAALEENDPELFVKAVGNVARDPPWEMTTVAQETLELGRPSLYKALSGERDPRIGTVMKVLGALGVRLGGNRRAKGGLTSGLRLQEGPLSASLSAMDLEPLRGSSGEA